MNAYLDYIIYPKPEEKVDHQTHLNDIQGQFKIPILYNEKVKTVDKNVIENLELPTLYTKLFGENNCHISNLCSHYTTDKQYLKEQQKILQSISFKTNSFDESTFHTRWKELMLHPNVADTYYFIDWKHLEFLNYNSKAMMYIGFTNIISPVLTLLTPFTLLIIPFIIIKIMKRENITASSYVKILMEYAKRNAFGKSIYMLIDGNASTKITGITMLCLYFSTLYQNVLLCMRYYSNLYKIKRYIQDTNALFTHTIETIEIMEKHMQYHTLFIEHASDKKQEFIKRKESLSFINDHIFSIFDILHIGKLMSQFYTLRFDKQCQTLYQYAFELCDYVKCVSSLQTHIHSKALQTCIFGDKTSLKSSFHLSLLHDKPVKNTINIDKNYIITGPNASGKTTLIKGTMLNILLSQQFGYGCYKEKTVVSPYDSFYSYLNIPDTSQRDSLFQAEARRCLHIIKRIESNTNEKTFLIFDELYSGTNPYEATLAAIAFINHISKQNVHFMITTHYYDICNAKKIHSSVHNIHMTCTKQDNELHYGYKIEKGQSKQKGGFKVLKDMNYPHQIIDEIISYENENAL